MPGLPRNWQPHRSGGAEAVSGETRRLADDLRAIRRREIMFEALNRPEIRRDRAADALSLAHRVAAILLCAIALVGVALIVGTITNI